MLEQPRNIFLKNAEINFAKLDTPVNPFGTPIYELQAATTDADVAAEWASYGLNVKEKDGKHTVGLKRKQFKADGTENAKVIVVDKSLNPVENVRQIGNGTTANVKVFQYPYEHAGRKGIASSLTAVQIVDLVVYNPTSNDFDILEDQPEDTVDTSNDLF